MKSRSSQSLFDDLSLAARRPSRAVTQASRLSELANAFLRFRRRHPRGSRVPKDLRAAVLDALRNGVAPGAVYRSCGISWGQVNAWKASEVAAVSMTGGSLNREKEPAPTRRGPRRRVVSKDVRVFNVADVPAPAVAFESELELRLGPWSVSVRLAPDAMRQR